jgi:phage shock protein PspC (stress-responsive transcriptional regulator)/predicted Ser/Thr protein kinase
MTTDDPANLLAAAKDSTKVLGGASTWTPLTPQELNGLIPGLTVEALLGRGGMGAVYRARQVRLDRPVALKVLPPEMGRDPVAAERFAREVRTMAKLSHPGLVTVYDHGQVGELLWLTMELVEGANLRQVMETGSLSPETALRLIPRLCAALQYAHDNGVIHRDLKPENILIDAQGAPWIADFGLAKMTDEDGAGLTQTGQLLGTYRYMAPEQLTGAKTVDHRADIYALGVVLYELLTGSLPQGRFEPPSRRVAIDVRLDEVVLRSLERDPQRRYQRADAMSQAVEAAGKDSAPLPEVPVAAVPASPSRPEWWRRMHGMRRSRGDRMLAGVCGGLGAATPLPSWLWRAILLITVFCWGTGFLAYCIMWFSMPKGTDAPVRTPVLVWVLLVVLVSLIVGFAFQFH